MLAAMHFQERRQKILLERIQDLITLAVSSNITRKTVMMAVLFLRKECLVAQLVRVLH